MKETSSIYKILKTSWGIWIKIQATSEKLNSQSKSKIKSVSNRIFTQKGENLKLKDDVFEFFLQGLKWVSEDIESKINGKLLITLEEIELVHANFQTEGLFYAGAFWASEHFEFQMPEYRYSYNKESNKYDFPDLNY